MFSMGLTWDVLVAATIGNKRVIRRFTLLLSTLERLAGATLILLAASAIAMPLVK
ncbi:hypothetical protein [Chitinolyticbacter meiyuanensis]|uniref:hypothetical protein n=1 Tax=Chitinolyticbacter meiyuanensis TaxID=682798 RepID=UPI0016521566|nr:hypothetical protein [Chitinolyticbacter meiyuanensis]